MFENYCATSLGSTWSVDLFLCLLTYLTSYFQVFVDEVFENRWNHDMRGLNEIQKLKLGDSQGTPSKYFKQSQASKLGDATHPVGERSMNFKKIPTLTQDLSMEMQRYERESESTYPCRSLSGSVKKRGWCSRTSPRSKSQVVPRSKHDLAPNGRHLRVQHTYGLMTPSPPRSSEWWWSSSRVPAARRRGDGGEEQFQ